jgi:hypothetical protein
LGGEYRVEGFGVVEELAAQAAVEAFYLSGGGRGGGLGESVGDGVVAADPVEEHFPALAEPVGELLAIVGQYLIGDAIAAQVLSTPGAASSRGRPTRARTPGTGMRGARKSDMCRMPNAGW